VKHPSLLFVLLVALALGGCSLAGDITPPPGFESVPSLPTAAPSLAAPRLAPDLSAGEALFAEKCAPCHGPTGRGDGAQASNLPVPPAVLAEASIARSAIPDEWYSLVTIGRLDRFMPGFTSLNDSDRWSVVAYALSLGLEQDVLDQGEQVFQRACAECHAEDGRGGESGSDLTAPGFQAERSLQAIFDGITQGVAPGMPGFEASLSEEERWAAASYVRELGLQAGPIAAQPTTTVTAEAAPSGTAGPAETGAPTTPAATTAASAPPVLVGVIEGTVLSGTAGAALPDGLEVTLHGLDGETEVITETKAVGPDGRFAFDVDELVSGRLFVATLDYGGELYASEVVHLTAETPTASLPVTVYEATTEAASVQVDRLHILVSSAGEGLLQIVELWILSNTGDRTVIPPADGGGLGGSLPEGAAQVSFDEPTPGERYRVVGSEFFDRRGLQPGAGTGEWVFSYILPYERRVDLLRTTDYAIGSIVLLLPEGMSVSAEGLVDTGSRDLQGESLHTYSLGPISPQEEIRLTLSGGPRSTGSPTAAAEWIIGVAVLGIALIVVGLVWRRSPRPRAAGIETEEADLLLSLAALDRDFEAGRISEDDYRRRREPLKRRAMSTLRRSHD
jgi:mono/diheme cytochrome c family protein